MKKIIIFGATGHVGSYMTKYFQDYFNQEEYQIIASGKRQQTNVFKEMNVDYISVDITKEEDFDKLPSNDVFAVINLASELPAYMDKYDGKKYLNSIIYGTYNILEYCRKTKANRILYSTSCFDVINYPTGTIIKPDMKLNYSYSGDHAIYVICKNTAIELINHYREEYGIKSFIFRFPNIYSYSPNQYVYHDDKKIMRPLYKCINNAIEGKDIEIWGDPEFKKDMVYVDDVSQMFAKAIENTTLDKGMYNCGTGVAVTTMEQMQTIIKVFGNENKKSNIVVYKDRNPGKAILMDVQNAKDELGYIPQFDVVKLFEEFKKEMKVNRFKELREDK